jgi:hypothetical protein
MTSVTKGGTQKLPQKFKIVETYWRDHSLESSCVARPDGTTSFSIHPFEGKIFWIFLKKHQSFNNS